MDLGSVVAMPLFLENAAGGFTSIEEPCRLRIICRDLRRRMIGRSLHRDMLGQDVGLAKIQATFARLSSALCCLNDYSLAHLASALSCSVFMRYVRLPIFRDR